MDPSATWTIGNFLLGTLEVFALALEVKSITNLGQSFNDFYKLYIEDKENKGDKCGLENWPVLSLGGLGFNWKKNPNGGDGFGLFGNPVTFENVEDLQLDALVVGNYEFLPSHRWLPSNNFLGGHVAEITGWKLKNNDKSYNCDEINSSDPLLIDKKGIYHVDVPRIV